MPHSLITTDQWPVATHQSVFVCARLCLVPTPESGDEYFEDDIIKTNNKVTIEYYVPVIRKSWEERRLVELQSNLGLRARLGGKVLERSDPSLSPKLLVTVRTKRLSPAARTRTWQNTLIPIRCILAFFKTSDFPAASPIFLHQRLIHRSMYGLGPTCPFSSNSR